jgi:hypothetical protein
LRIRREQLLVYCGLSLNPLDERFAVTQLLPLLRSAASTALPQARMLE